MMENEVERETGRARITMEWELDVEYITTEAGRIRCTGWLADPQGTLAQCVEDNCRRLTIERLS